MSTPSYAEGTGMTPQTTWPLVAAGTAGVERIMAGTAELKKRLEQSS